MFAVVEVWISEIRDAYVKVKKDSEFLHFDKKHTKDSWKQKIISVVCKHTALSSQGWIELTNRSYLSPKSGLGPMAPLSTFRNERGEGVKANPG